MLLCFAGRTGEKWCRWLPSCPALSKADGVPCVVRPGCIVVGLECWSCFLRLCDGCALVYFSFLCSWVLVYVPCAHSSGHFYTDPVALLRPALFHPTAQGVISAHMLGCLWRCLQDMLVLYLLLPVSAFWDWRMLCRPCLLYSYTA